MTKLELFMEGVNLMFSGMGFVLGFLILLIFLISLMSKIINRFVTPPPLTAATSTTNKSVSIQPTDDLERLRPVIIAAIAHHRRQQGIK
ncbi:oxaloacetate decarboxylase subunit gamma [Gallibacterium anatis]|uniref:Probable oxaloacetate decarboxylase gamma chain n=3 Tax=Gallibacterium anatis TaxID=750 RepID=A0A0A3AGW8_9PAST|nr:oxaloacetate decarboxylase subunit gamma [Gallibacterium anatis]ERF77952.1 oxaloacetate decarboxylase subunit gamma [Gallibacterium anatis 12656/12]KGQ24006.1 oxaloacetate decarboxylase gamma chain [Gallibacterium anatis]KGQ25977.1 oxaloacetate decarboxylase gamma chain [Gallibacterium anatis CCM5995]KGQ27740.1 oxaloacetate decarboxylase gamma chain [Gallibacterium anatis]KGQ36122.1 oxaloacetate decarboxylase gamma chain [Gallibacterium anatis]